MDKFLERSVQIQPKSITAGHSVQYFTALLLYSCVFVLLLLFPCLSYFILVVFYFFVHLLRPVSLWFNCLPCPSALQLCWLPHLCLVTPFVYCVEFQFLLSVCQLWFPGPSCLPFDDLSLFSGSFASFVYCLLGIFLTLLHFGGGLCSLGTFTFCCVSLLLKLTFHFLKRVSFECLCFWGL